jgi:aminoglycoside phosphotransferase family enzyme
MLSQKDVVRTLRNPSAYPHEVLESISVIETNISWIFLTGKYAYKMKKSIKFGDVLDFTSLEKRHETIKAELVLNKRMAPDLYLSVEMVDSQGKIGLTSDPVEYLVKMVQLPQSSLLLSILKDKSSIDDNILKKIAAEISIFHKQNIVYPEFSIYDSIFEKWDENFRTTKTYLGFPFDESLEERVYKFLEANKDIFDKRKEEGKIVDGHGDLIVGNIFYNQNKVIIFDCIEFNKMLRIQDILEEVAFLSMDLDFHKQVRSSEFFIQQYMKNMGEKIENHFKLLDFYKSYRAYVRAKVYYSLALQEDSEDQKQELKSLASEYMVLASSYVF